MQRPVKKNKMFPSAVSALCQLTVLIFFLNCMCCVIKTSRTARVPLWRYIWMNVFHHTIELWLNSSLVAILRVFTCQTHTLRTDEGFVGALSSDLLHWFSDFLWQRQHLSLLLSVSFTLWGKLWQNFDFVYRVALKPEICKFNKAASNVKRKMMWFKNRKAAQQRFFLRELPCFGAPRRDTAHRCVGCGHDAINGRAHPLKPPQPLLPPSLSSPLLAVMHIVIASKISQDPPSLSAVHTGPCPLHLLRQEKQETCPRKEGPGSVLILLCEGGGIVQLLCFCAII